MSSEYTVLQYLLDRANIEDTIKNMYFHLDHKDFDAIATTSLADEVNIDYSDLLGDKPYTATGKDQVVTWARQTKGFKSSQHAVAGVMTQLPQPGSGPAPDSTTAVANAVVTLIPESGPVMKNCGRLYVTLTRSGKGSGNPWRLSGMRVEKVWVLGEFDKFATEE